ncbi:MAG: RrF2 family transcriptional regulator, partial [bacterium]
RLHRSGTVFCRLTLRQSPRPQFPALSVSFSSKVEYGLVALMELAGSFATGEVLQVAEIASRQSIPDRYLEQMLAMLRRGGLLSSVRGPRGGYRLTRSPAEITVAEVVHCLEGEAAGRPVSPQRTLELEVLHALAVDLQRQRRELLAGTTLHALLERRDALSQSQVMYFI